MNKNLIKRKSKIYIRSKEILNQKSNKNSDNSLNENEIQKSLTSKLIQESMLNQTRNHQQNVPSRKEE